MPSWGRKIFQQKNIRDRFPLYFIISNFLIRGRLSFWADNYTFCLPAGAARIYQTNNRKSVNQGQKRTVPQPYTLYVWFIFLVDPSERKTHNTLCRVAFIKANPFCVFLRSGYSLLAKTLSTTFCKVQPDNIIHFYSCQWIGVLQVYFSDFQLFL